MTVWLLDANVLIALIDRQHVEHDVATRWFLAQRDDGWATCPLTENAVLRIVGGAGYRNSPGSPSAVMPALIDLCSHGGHVFWADNLSLRDQLAFFHDRLLTSAQLTDTYLLALAKHHGGALATFDRRLVSDAVEDGMHYVRMVR